MSFNIAFLFIKSVYDIALKINTVRRYDNQIVTFFFKGSQRPVIFPVYQVIGNAKGVVQALRHIFISKY